MLRGRPRKKQQNTSGLKNQSAPHGNENDAPTISADLKEVHVCQPQEQLKDGVGSEVESDDEDEEDGVSLEWGGFGEEEFGQRLADMAHNDDPNDIDSTCQETILTKIQVIHTHTQKDTVRIQCDAIVVNHPQNTSCV